MNGNNPDIRWALDLLAPDPTYEENFLSKNYPWIVEPFMTVEGVAYLNWFQSRPVYASFPQYGVALALGLVGAKVLKDAKYHREAQRDMVLRHYIKLHPEDFPAPAKILK